MDSGEALHAHTFSFCLVDALVDAGAPAVLALALAAFMLADAGAPAALAGVTPLQVCFFTRFAKCSQVSSW